MASGIDKFVRDRFLHGASTISVQENWIAFLSGYAWRNLDEPVTPRKHIPA